MGAFNGQQDYNNKKKEKDVQQKNFSSKITPKI